MAVSVAESLHGERAHILPLLVLGPPVFQLLIDGGFPAAGITAVREEQHAGHLVPLVPLVEHIERGREPGADVGPAGGAELLHGLIDLRSPRHVHSDKIAVQSGVVAERRDAKAVFRRQEFHELFHGLDKIRPIVPLHRATPVQAADNIQ